MSVLPSDTRPTDTGSRTMTMTHTPSQAPASPSNPNLERPDNVGTLRLRGGPVRRRTVMWSKETVDNEGMGKKKSKICCIYHRPKAFDESSSESSSGSDGEDANHSDNANNRKKLNREQKDHRSAPEEMTSESDGGAGDGRARKTRIKHRSHHHSRDCRHIAEGKHDPKANKYDQKGPGS